MFKFTRPPQNSIDAAATWIHPKDPAWDKSRINDEIKAMAKADPPIEEDEHPIARWNKGEVVFDLEATMSHPGPGFGSVTARDYLDGTQVVFTIKPFETVAESMDYNVASGDGHSSLARMAVAKGLVKIEANGETIQLHRNKSGELDERSMLMLHHSDGTGLLIFHLGGAIANLGSGAPTKKP